MRRDPEFLGDFRILRRLVVRGADEIFLGERRDADGKARRFVVKRALREPGRDTAAHARLLREALLRHPVLGRACELIEHPRDRLLLAIEHVDEAELDLPGAAEARPSGVGPSRLEDIVQALLDLASSPALQAETEKVVGAPEAARRGDPRPSLRLFSAGAQVGRYRVEEHLGRGGMADVYAARDTTLDRQVALKILRGTTKDEARRQLLREAKLAARFEHPGSVVVYDVGEADGVSFIAMELVRGVLLSAFVGDPDVPIPRRIRWLVSAARVLAAAHAGGLVHRDVKPGNLMIREGGEVKVLDFGIARINEGPGRGEQSSSGGAFVGTLRYAAPERFSPGQVDGRADQFSWGVTAWELLAGKHPCDEGEGVEAFGNMLAEGVRSLAEAAPDLPEEVIRVVDRALDLRPERRFVGLDDAADQLEPFAEAPLSRPARGPLVDAGEPAPSPRLAPPPARAISPRGIAALAAAGVAALIGLGAVGGMRFATSTPAAPVSSAAAAPEIEALACEPAVVEGDAGPALARAVGMGACARLASEIGVDWAVPEAAHHLEVRAVIHPERSQITLRLAGREATGSGAAPVPALWAAIASLAPQLRSPAWSAEQIHLWGARDEASARRIFRVWRHSSIRVLPNVTTEIVHLMETDGDSPIPHLLSLMNAVGGRDLNTARQRIGERLDRLPRARADSIRGQLLAFPAERDRKEAIRLMREAYAAGPDDHAMTALYGVLAARLGLPEAHAVIERLHQQAPTYSISPLDNGVSRTAYRDDAQSVKYIAWLDALLPEAVGRIYPVQRLASLGRFAEARAGLDLAGRLGLDGPAADPLYLADARAQIELAALAPAAARGHTTMLLGDPRFYGSMRGSLALVASSLQEGHFLEAAGAMREHAERQMDQGNGAGALQFSLASLRLSRWLGREVDPKHAPLLRRVFAEDTEVPPQHRMQVEVELALVEGRHRAEETLARLAAEAEREAAGELLVRDRALVVTLPLVRALHGDRDAVALWGHTEHAPTLARRSAALDAALAFEATGDLHGAEDAYRLAADAANNLEDAAQRVLALARLAILHRKMKHGNEAAAEEETLDRLWSAADPGLREAVKRMR